MEGSLNGKLEETQKAVLDEEVAAVVENDIDSVKTSVDDQISELAEENHAGKGSLEEPQPFEVFHALDTEKLEQGEVADSDAAPCTDTDTPFVLDEMLQLVGHQVENSGAAGVTEILVEEGENKLLDLPPLDENSGSSLIAAEMVPEGLYSKEETDLPSLALSENLDWASDVTESDSEEGESSRISQVAADLVPKEVNTIKTETFEVSSDLLDLAPKENGSDSLQPGDVQNSSGTIEHTMASETSSDLSDLASASPETVDDNSKNTGESSDHSDTASMKIGEDSLPLPVGVQTLQPAVDFQGVQTSIRDENSDESKNPERAETQFVKDVFAVSPRMQTTSWRSCCGLVDLLMRR